MKKLIYSIFALTLVTSNITFAQSDDPCGAPALNPGATCSYTAATLPSSATATSGVPAPGCASYNGQDVWYQVVVPAAGTLTIDLNTSSGGPTDMGMAWYSASSCSGPFTLIECDDDDSPNGLLPRIARTGLTPGNTIWVRIWEYGGNATGNFRICSFSPPPPNCEQTPNNSCTNPQPFCAGAPVTYCNSSGPSMGSYSCLSSTPNPTWLYMEIANSGNMNIGISQESFQGNPIDVDFALYGPYSNIATACNNIGPSTPTVSCSFSASATETVTLNNAQAGQVYILLVTNYNGAAGQIEFNQTSGSGGTNCSIVQPCTVSATMVRDTCSSGVGSVTAVPGAGIAPLTYVWSTLGNQTTATVNGVRTGVHTVTMTTGDGCTATANVTVENYNPTSTSSSTPVTCSGASNGTATATMTPAIGNVTYLWNDANAQTTQTATGLPPGSYTCTMTSSRGCAVTATVVVTEIPGLTATITNQHDVTCNSGNDGIAQVNASGGTAPYSYLWGASASSTHLATDLPAGQHTVVITDATGCNISKTVTLAEPPPLSIAFITPDTVICPESSIDITVTGAGGSSAYAYSWTSNGVEVGTTQTINVDPVNSGTQYCLTLTEACGSPSTQSCMTITFPTEIVPNIVPDRYKDCQPATFVFTNASNNPYEIATTHYAFGNGMDSTVNGSMPSTSTFIDARKYTMDVIITSIYGCVYTKTFPDIVEAIAIPTAAFTMSSNPTTIFETVVQMQDASSMGSIYWDWSAPDATPAYSSTQNPVFSFPEGLEGAYPIQLVVTTEEGCTDTVVNILNVTTDIIFYAPNAFTPDGDEHNQTWKFYVAGIDVYNFNIQIFNRWGEMIWESNDPNEGWDGTYGGRVMQEGTYNWKASVKDIYSDNKKEFRGSMTILK